MYQCHFKVNSPLFFSESRSNKVHRWPSDAHVIFGLELTKEYYPTSNDLQMTFTWPWMTLTLWYQDKTRNAFINVFASKNADWPWFDLDLTSRSTFTVSLYCEISIWTFLMKSSIWPWNDLHDFDMTLTSLFNGNDQIKCYSIHTKFLFYCSWQGNWEKWNKLGIRILNPLHTRHVSSHPGSHLGGQPPWWVTCTAKR